MEKLPIKKDTISLREEFDDWAILFDPDANKAVGLNDLGVVVWKFLDGNHTMEDVIKELNEICEDVPEDAEEQIKTFIEELLQEEFVRQK